MDHLMMTPIIDPVALQRQIVTIDTHVDIPWPPGPPVDEDGPRKVDLPKLRRGDVGAVCFAAYVPQGPRTRAGHAAAASRAHAMLDVINAMGDLDRVRVTDTADAIVAARREKVVAVIPCVENGYAMGEDLDELARFRAKGARYMTLTHNGHNALADSSNPRRDLGDGETLHGGLSGLGREAVAEMNRLGMLVDISHVSLQTALQAIKHSRTPVAATHSNSRKMCDVPRNADDQLLDALRDTGGMINLTAVPSFLLEGARPEEVTNIDFMNHLDYIAQRIGTAHIGISSDFDGGGGYSNWRDASQSWIITRDMIRRGYSAGQVEQMWGGNFLRLLRQAEAASDAGAKAAAGAANAHA